MRMATVLIFAKPPRMGLAKTRLARGLGSPTQARRIASMTLSRTLRTVSQVPARAILYIAPDHALTDPMGEPMHQRFTRRSQGDGDLTARLNRGLSEAPIGPVLFIGADAPDLSPKLLRRAVCSLHRHDSVFGPARDGGFWLFGLNKTSRTRSPFHDCRWSGPHAMEDVWRNLPESARVDVLPRLIDIDEAQDWRDWTAQRRR